MRMLTTKEGPVRVVLKRSTWFLLILLLSTTINTVAMDDQQLPMPSDAPVMVTATDITTDTTAATTTVAAPVAAPVRAVSLEIPDASSSVPIPAPTLAPDDTTSTGPVTPAPSKAPKTPAPVMPVTVPPVTSMPVTAAPVVLKTNAPTLPVTPAPVTAVPATLAPVTGAPESAAPSETKSFKPSFTETGMPTTAPPTAPPTRAATDSPVTIAPVTQPPTTMAPTLTGLPVEPATLGIVIASVSGEMGQSQQEFFLATTQAFLSETLALAENPVFSVMVQVMEQTVLGVESGRRLQEASLMVSITVNGTVTEKPEDVDFTLLCSLMFSINGSLFADALRNSGREYFKAINSVSAVELSEAPSSVPSSTPTTQDPSAIMPSNGTAVSAAPSENNSLMVTDRFALTLYSVTARMSSETAETFRATTQIFLAARFTRLEQPVTNIRLQVVGQTLQSNNGLRRLQDLSPLEVELLIEGNFSPVQGGAMTSEDLDLSRLSRNFIDAENDLYIDLLQESDRVEDAVYFASINSAATVSELSDLPISGPASAPAGPSSGGGGLAVGAIVAIALCGTLAVLVTAAALVQSRRRGKGGGIAKASSSKDSSKNDSKTKEPSTNRPAPSSYDGDSVLLSDMQSEMGTDTLAGMDTMSYAYSLDHGIDPSVSSGAPGTDYYSSSSGAVPNEIPMVGSRESASNVDFDNLYDGLSSQGQPNKITRECFAPPGKLGIVIDTTAEGPVVHKVNPGSPLEGIVWPGDIIIAIDDVDTRSLEADDITALMVKNMDQRRKLTILSDA